MKPRLLNFAGFQLCWFANVLAAAHGLPWAGPLLTLAWLGAHVALLRDDAPCDARVILAGAAFGWLADSALVLAGLIAFPEPARLGAPTTIWMVALWAGFAATLRHALGWLRGRWLAGAVLGALGGPLAYLAGESLGAIVLSGHAAFAAVALQYALATPLLLLVVSRCERTPDTARARIAVESRP